MRVLILANNDGGLFKFRRELLEEFVKQYKVFVSVPEGEFTDEIRKIGCRVSINKWLERRGTNPVQDLRVLQYYCRVLKKVKPDIVFTYTIKPNVYGGIACGRYHIPYVVNVTGLGTSIENGGILQKITLLLYKAGLRKAQIVFFQNTENRDYFLEHGIVKGKFDVLPGSGVNPGQHCYEAYPADTEELVFSTVGRIMKDKGIDEILSAAGVIKGEYPKVRFRLIGCFEEDYEEKIREAEKAGIIEYMEEQREIHPIMKESHAVLHASYHEGMSNVLLEAAATGRPVIASNIPGCREIYEEGVSGIGFEARCTEDLIRALKDFIKLPYEKKEAMGKAGREKVIKEFDRRIVVEKYMKEIQNAADLL